MSRRRLTGEGGFVLAEMWVALLVLAVCAFGVWTVAEQMRENRQEREWHVEALMIAQRVMETVDVDQCRPREEPVSGRWSSYRVRVERETLMDDWMWCRAAVSWQSGKRRSERIVELGKLVPAISPTFAP